MSAHPFDEALAAYALGALDEAERGAFETHLETCVDCQRELAGLSRVTTALGMAIVREPPGDLKARTIARAAAQAQDRPATRPTGTPPGSPFQKWLALAAGIAIVIGLLGYVFALQAEVRMLTRVAADAEARVEALRLELSDIRQHSNRLENTLAVLSAPDLLSIDLRSQTPDSPALGRAFMSGARGVLFNVENLPVLPSDRAYQVWAVAPGGGPVGIGLFTVDATGASSVSLSLPSTLTNPRTIAVTVEPANGSPGPTSPIVLIGRLAG
jgi:anti-sigma-K factor RskA